MFTWKQGRQGKIHTYTDDTGNSPIFIGVCRNPGPSYGHWYTMIEGSDKIVYYDSRLTLEQVKKCTLGEYLYRLQEMVKSVQADIEKISGK